jgi:hypothetical protein
MINPFSVRYPATPLYFGHNRSDKGDKNKPHDHHHEHGDHCDIHGNCCAHDHSTCNHDHGHHQHEHAPKKPVSIGQRIANAFNAVIRWFKEFFIGIFKDAKTLSKGPDEHIHHDHHDHHHDHDHKH